jgi:hypothetical protein
MDPLIIAVLMTEYLRKLEQEMDKEAQHMDPFHLYQYTKIRHEERLQSAANWQGESEPSFIWRAVAAARRTISTLLAVRVTLTVHTADRRRSVTEPDVCIE